jgi:sulfite reductase (NADPH) flavoprotein alpha-component
VVDACGDGVYDPLSTSNHLQERVALAATGMPVGPMHLYFGARHRATEFLYGDELTGAHAGGSGVLKGLRLAFSRDAGGAKVYIQHLMEADGKILSDALHRDGGSFYLCGPTWPEPDVEAAMVAAFERHAGLGGVPGAGAALVRRLKDAKRYVLEVY